MYVISVTDDVRAEKGFSMQKADLAFNSAKWENKFTYVLTYDANLASQMTFVITLFQRTEFHVTSEPSDRLHTETILIHTMQTLGLNGLIIISYFKSFFGGK